MSKSNVSINVKATLQIAKYPDWATEEDIKNGRVQPLEIVESEDNFNVDEDKLKKQEVFENGINKHRKKFYCEIYHK